MNKESTPRYMKEYAAALGSNPAKAQKIFSAIPPGKTRSVPGQRLGKGSEGEVHAAVTGGVGDSAVKVFSGEKIRQFHGAAPYADRAKVMADNPSVFPEVYGYGGRHIILEKLTDPSPGEFGFYSKPSVRRAIRDEVHMLRKDREGPDAAALAKYESRGLRRIRDAWPQRNTGGKYVADLTRLQGYLREFPRKNPGAWIDDVSETNNLMLSRRGSLVISDPMLKGEAASNGAPIRGRRGVSAAGSVASLAGLLGSLAYPRKADPAEQGR